MIPLGRSVCLLLSIVDKEKSWSMPPVFEALESSALNLEGTRMRNKIHCPLILDLCADDPNKWHCRLQPLPQRTKEVRAQ
jgi:hypothetical protein